MKHTPSFFAGPPLRAAGRGFSSRFSSLLPSGSRNAVFGISLKAIGCSLLLFSLSRVPASAVSVYIDFGAEFTTLPNTYSAAAEAPGEWNVVDSLGVTSDLVDTSGGNTAWSITLSAFYPAGRSGTQDDNFNETLLEDSFYSQEMDPWSVSISGLPMGLYDVIYYAPAHQIVSTGTFIMEGMPIANLPGNSDSALVQGESWDVFNDLLVADGSLDLASSSLVSFRGIAGLQIISVIPEPSRAMLSILGLGAVLARRRR